MLNVMALVWAFNFEQDLDSEGKPIPVDIYDMHDVIISSVFPNFEHWSLIAFNRV